MFNEKIQISKFLPKNFFFFRDFHQISMSLVKIGQNKWKKNFVIWIFPWNSKNRDFSKVKRVKWKVQHCKGSLINHVDIWGGGLAKWSYKFSKFSLQNSNLPKRVNYTTLRITALNIIRPNLEMLLEKSMNCHEPWKFLKT